MNSTHTDDDSSDADRDMNRTSPMERLFSAIGCLCAWRQCVITASAWLLTTLMVGQEIAVGQVVENEFWDSEDQLYSVQIGNADHYVIRVAGQRTNFERWSLLYSSISVFDNYGLEIFSAYGNGSDPAIVGEWLEPGNYSIRVSNGDYPWGGGSYSFSVQTYSEHLANLPTIEYKGSSDIRALVADGIVNLAFDVSGPGNLTYQWLKNDSPVEITPGPSYSINPELGMDDQYKLVVSNDVSVVISNIIRFRAVDSLELVAGQKVAVGQVVENEFVNRFLEKKLYEVQIENIDQYVIRVAGVGTNSDRWSLASSKISVFDENGLELFSTDSGGPGYDAAIIGKWLQPGHYSIEVSSYSNGKYAFSVQAYGDHLANSPAINNAGSSDIFALISDGNVTIQFDVSGPGNLKYQWLKNNSPLTSTTDSSYSIYPELGMDDRYQLVVSNDVTAVESNEIRLRAVDRLDLGELRNVLYKNNETHFYQVSIPSDGYYRISVQDSVGVDQWGLELLKFNPVKANFEYSFSIGNVGEYFLDAGIYCIQVNAYNWSYMWSFFDYNIKIESAGPPVITSQPLAQTVTAGQIASFRVEPGRSDLLYQWTRNGVVIPEATTSTLEVVTSDTSLSDSVYQVKVSNEVGSILSDQALLTVKPAVGTLAQGEVLFGIIDPAGDVDTYRFEVATPGIFDFQVLSAQLSSFYTLPSSLIQVTDARGNLLASRDEAFGNARVFVSLTPGSYFISVRASAYYSIDFSLAGTYQVTVQVLSLPVVTTQPAAVSVVEGQRAIFNVIGSSPAPLTYSWYRNGVALEAYTSSLTIQTTPELDGSVYTVRVGNLAGSIVSDPAILHVSPAPTLAVGQSLSAAIDPTLDIDWYQVSIDTPGFYVVNVAGNDSIPQCTLSNPSVALLDDTGVKIDEDDDSGPGLDPSLPKWLTSGNYIIAVTSDAYTTGTYIVSLLPFDSPTISAQPQSLSIVEGQSTNFSVTATSPAPLTYQWSRNGEPISGADAATYVAAAIGRGWDGSQFQVIVSNAAGSVTSDFATLYIYDRLPQSIIGFGSLPGHTFGDAPFVITGVSGGPSNNPIVYVSANEAVATVSGATVTIRGAGTTTITAMQAGDALYAPASVVAQTLVVARAAQSITFPPPSNRPFGTSTFSIGASASSGLPLAFTVQSGPGVVTGTQLSVSDIGPIVITAVQPGNANYLAATPVEQTLLVTQSEPIIATQPAGRELAIGLSGTIQVTVANPVGVTYAWFRDGVAIPGATNPELLVTAPTAGVASYYVVVVNRFGSTTSMPAVVRGIYVPVTIIEQPESASVDSGAAATFGVAVLGSQPISFQWQRDGVDISGANSSAFTTPTLSFTDHGSRYQVVVSNALGSVVSNPATLSVQAAPQISAPPQDGSANAGDPAIFAVQADGTPPLQYQWMRNGTLISGANSATVSLPTTVADDGALITVLVSNAYGSSLSAPATLHVTILPPAITSQPTAHTIGVGESVVLAVGVRSALPVTYAWYRDGAVIANATGAQLVVVGLELGVSDYHVVVNGSLGVVTSADARVTVINRSVLIETQPQARDVFIGQAADFSVVAQGTAPLSYQWLRDGMAIPGATAPIYTSSILGPSDDGAVYAVDVSNVTGTVRSASAILRVHAPPAIIAHPVDLTLYEGSVANFAVTAESRVPQTYQWFRNDQAIDGATGRTFASAIVTLADSGASYSVAVANLAGTTMAGPALLTVRARLPQTITGFAALEPQIVGAPDRQIIGVVGGASNNPVTFTSSNLLVAQVYGNFIRVVGVGSATITAKQAGNALYAPASPVEQSLTVNRGSQSITFAEIRPLSLGGLAIPLKANSSSGLPVTFAVLDGPGSIVGDTLALDGIGDVRVIASQPGNADFEPAEPVVRVVRIEAIAPRITNLTQSITAPIGGQVPLTVTVDNPRFATYQWFRNGSVINGATASTYTAIVPAPGVTDTYRVEVGNSAGTTRSPDATITGMIILPAIVAHPQSTTIYAGQTTTFSVQVQGSQPFMYQWFRAGVAIDGAVGATWTTPAVSVTDDQVPITVAVSNFAGTVLSNAALLRVHAPPHFLSQPANVQVNVGDPVEISATVDSTMPVTFQWYRNEVPILGASASTYRITETTVTDDGAVFRLSAANALGVTLSDLAMLRAEITAPVFTQQPSSVILEQSGGEVVFKVAARSALPVTFQWYRNDEAIAGATADRYAFTPSVTDLGAVFTVSATNAKGSTLSANATISQVAKPVITGQPQSSTEYVGRTAVFMVSAVSFDPARVLTYQWRRNGVDIPGATSRILTLENVDLTFNDTRYSVLIADGPLSLLSEEAVLHVKTDEQPPTILSISGDKIVDPGDTANFSVSVAGSAPIAVQWYRNGETIPGATALDYRTPPVLEADYGTRFFATATNAYGVVTSVEMHLSPLPLITGVSRDPSLEKWLWEIPAGDPVTFAATVRGAQPIAFRWFRNGVEIPGADKSSYVIPVVSVADDNAWFTVTASNTAGASSKDFPPLYVHADPPLIRENGPDDQFVSLGQTVNLAVNIDRQSPSDYPSYVELTYQWYRDGVAIVGEIESSYALRAVGDADLNARFHVVVSNRFGSTTSRQARLILQPFAFTKQPVSTTAQLGGPATFSVEVNYPRFAQYFWRKNGLFMPNARKKTFTIERCGPEENGSVYDVVVRQSSPYSDQEIVSNTALLLLVDTPPLILEQPKPVQSTIGQNAIFSVTATGREPLSYRWYRDGQLIDDENSPILSVPVLSLSEDGARIHVVVSNERGSVTSETVTLGARFIPATVISDPDTVAEIHGDSVLIHPRAYVSNGDREDILYKWSQLSGPPLSELSSRFVSFVSSARLSLTNLKPGSYALRCEAVYGSETLKIGPFKNGHIDDTYHVFRFQVTQEIAWVTIPRMVGTLSESLAVRIEAVAGFNGVQDPATSYDWIQVEGPAPVTFALNHAPAAKQSQVQLPQGGRYVVSCTATWRDTKITKRLVIDTDADSAEQDDATTLASLQKRSLLIAAAAFEAALWSEKEDFRTAYLAGVEPGRVWQSAPPGGGRTALRTMNALRRTAAAGATVTLRVQTVAGAPVSWATLHGGAFTPNGLNAITVAADATGEAAVDLQIPSHAGTYQILAASPLAVGRLSFTVVVP